MSALWAKLRPHILSWHMLPCLVMILVAVAIVVATGRPSALLGAVGCMVMMTVMMAAMGGHRGAGHHDQD
jgi:hypothetical protein